MAITFKNRITKEKQPVKMSRFVTESLIESSPYLVYQIEATSHFSSQKTYYIGYTGSGITQRMGEHFRDRRKIKVWELLNMYAKEIDVKILAIATTEQDAREVEKKNIKHAAKKYRRHNLINEMHARTALD